MAIENGVTFLPCSDINRTEQFYRKIIGLKLVQEQNGGLLKIFDTGYGYWGFCQYGDGRPTLGGDTGVCLSLNCADEADVDAQYERILQRGAEIKALPQKQKNFPVYAFFLRDPDDYKVEFQKILLPEQELVGGKKAEIKEEAR